MHIFCNYSTVFAAIRPTTYSEWEETEGAKMVEVAKADMKERRRKEKELSQTMNGVGDIAVVGDGGWGKRSLGHSYDANTGNTQV